jgi:hypothetical protein
MKGRSTLVLLISILVLGSFIWIQETWRAKVPSREYQRLKLFDLDTETLVSLEFQHTNLVVECVKQNGVWMTGSSSLGLGRADVALMHQVVAGLNSMGKGTTITAEHLAMRGLDEAEYGLAKPGIRIRAVDNRGEHSWYVGRNSPLGDMVYVKDGDGDDIYTVLGTLLKIIPTEVDQLRERVVFSGEIPGIRRLEIRDSDGFVQLLKGAKGEWQIQQPISAQADSAEVGDFLEKLHGLHIEDFIADNVSDYAVYGLQGESLQISLGGVGGVSRMLILGDEIPDRSGFIYARHADDTSVFSLKKDVLDMLSFKLEDFRDRRVLLQAAKGISSISITRGSEQLDLGVNKAGLWEITTPVSWDADIHAVAGLLQMWNDAVVFEFNDEGSDESAEWTFAFGSSTLGQTNLIHVLPRRGRKDGIRIKRDDDSTVYQLNLQSVPDSAIDPLSYKDRLVWQLNSDDIQKISLTHSMAEQQTVERTLDGSFSPCGTNGNVQVDATILQEVLAGLKVLLHVSLTGTNQIGRVLWIGEEVDQGYYAMVQGRDVVFLLDKAVVDNLSRNLLVPQEIAVSDPE